MTINLILRFPKKSDLNKPLKNYYDEVIRR